jgi:hypothetical protein
LLYGQKLPIGFFVGYDTKFYWRNKIDVWHEGWWRGFKESLREAYILTHPQYPIWTILVNSVQSIMEQRMAPTLPTHDQLNRLSNAALCGKEWGKWY